MTFKCDLLIVGARVIDGSGGASRFIDVAVDRDRIVDLGDCRHWQADTRIDAHGQVLAPGFIDSHTHDDLAVLETPELACKLSQGVTTVIAGNCGMSLAPLSPVENLPPPFPLLGAARAFRYPSVRAYREALQRNPSALNLALLTGHSNLRLDSMPTRLDQAADATACSLCSRAASASASGSIIRLHRRPLPTK
jgi:N-acyl-D-amino-acid deacylase